MSVGKQSEEEIKEEAKNRVKVKKNFFKHLALYIVIVVLIIIIWAIVRMDSTWWIWPLVVWGIGILGYYLALFVFPQGMASNIIKEQTEWTKRRAELIRKEAELKKKQVEKEFIKLKKSETNDGEQV